MRLRRGLKFAFIAAWVRVSAQSYQSLSCFCFLFFDEMVGTDAVAVCQAHRELPVGFLSLRYSVLFTVESLSLLYLLDLYDLGDDALISLWSFMQTKYLCVLIHI